MKTRSDLFTLLFNQIAALPKFQGSNGTLRVYDYPIAQPAGYPYAIIASDTLESQVYDTARDLRLYNFLISITGEKFGDTGGLTQSQALATMRDTEDVVMALIDDANRLGGAGLGVIRTLPISTVFGYAEGNSRVILEIKIQFQVAVEIVM